MQPELICCNFREQAGSRLTFFNRLAGLLGGKHLPAALFARVFKYDVLDVFEERLRQIPAGERHHQAYKSVLLRHSRDTGVRRLRHGAQPCDGFNRREKDRDRPPP